MRNLLWENARYLTCYISAVCFIWHCLITEPGRRICNRILHPHLINKFRAHHYEQTTVRTVAASTWLSRLFTCAKQSITNMRSSGSTVLWTDVILPYFDVSLLAFWRVWNVNVVIETFICVVICYCAVLFEAPWMLWNFKKKWQICLFGGIV